MNIGINIGIGIAINTAGGIVYIFPIDWDHWFTPWDNVVGTWDDQGV